MKLCDLTYAEATQRHPTEVSLIVGALRKSRSKHRATKPEDLKWSYECAVLIEGPSSFADILSGAMQADQERRDAMSLEERVADQVRRTRTCLQGAIGRWADSAAVPNPSEVETKARESWSCRMKEQAEYAALPEEEKTRLRDEALAQLSGQPGFMAIQIPVPRTR